MTDGAAPFIARLLRVPSGLRAGGASDDAVATYHGDDGGHPFAFCRDGLLVDPYGAARFVPYAEIAAASYHDGALLRSDKRRKEKGERVSSTLPLRLAGGEVIELPLNAHPEGMSERLTIARLIEQRAAIARAKEKRPLRTGEEGVLSND